MHAQFDPVAAERGLDFITTIAPDAPPQIETDKQRVAQIIKNLLFNAFKFTETGSVTLVAAIAMREGQPMATLSVIDTGIGMTPEQQQIVFEAFRQADGSTSRKYEGTGLGLTISQELAHRMGGEITLESEYGQGSTFTLYLPTTSPKSEVRSQESGVRSQATHNSRPTIHNPTANSQQPSRHIPDDRDTLKAGDRVLLIVEDDADFAKIVSDYARNKGFKCMTAGDGKHGLRLAQEYQPDAIILDLNLPHLDGWQVLNVLKDLPETRHIPVHIMSVDDETLDAYKRGAMGFLTKPVSPENLDASFQWIEDFIAREVRTLLVVEDDANLRHSVSKLLGGDDVQIVEVGSGKEALEQLQSQHFDCMILDLNLPDMSGFNLLSRMHKDKGIPRCPVIVYTGRALTEEENLELLKYADSVIVKGVKSPERLLDETALFLHQVVAKMPVEKQKTIKRLHDQEAILANKQVLLVDDDTRNAFALSKLLWDKGVQVTIAGSGSQALEFLDQHSYDLVLMDIMMPEMDGYETMAHIRKQPKFRNLPILALTAKAMKGDREKCIAAGASDYLPKPVDPDRLFSMLRVWLYQ
jgi:CheY-like chemotaxis protein